MDNVGAMFNSTDYAWLTLDEIRMKAKPDYFNAVKDALAL